MPDFMIQHHPPTLGLPDLLKPFPLEWEEQRATLME
jgi:hypothetical protein